MARKTDRKNRQVSAAMKLAELVDMNINLIGVLARLGIGFGFGDDTVAEACEKHGVSTETFLLISNVYTIDNYVPSTNLLREADLKDIVTYLRRSHSFYLDCAVKALEDSLSVLIRPCDEKFQKVIWKFFSQYKDELSKHFDFEEERVFPYVMSVLDHAKACDFTILQYEENHTNVEEKLSDLKNIVLKYLPAECDPLQVITVLNSIDSLEKDLEKHTLIEDDILVPVVNSIEQDEK